MLHHCYDLNQSPHDTNGVEKKEGIGLSLTVYKGITLLHEHDNLK